MAAELSPRPLWLTVPLYVIALCIVGVDVWAVFFWSAVGESIGVGLSLTGAAVALILTALVLSDGRRQWLLFHYSSQEAGQE
jgi:hypothetical protein